MLSQVSSKFLIAISSLVRTLASCSSALGSCADLGLSSCSKQYGCFWGADTITSDYGFGSVTIEGCQYSSYQQCWKLDDASSCASESTCKWSGSSSNGGNDDMTNNSNSSTGLSGGKIFGIVSNSSTGLSGGKIFGIVLAVVPALLGLAGLAAFYFLVWKKQKENNKQFVSDKPTTKESSAKDNPEVGEAKQAAPDIVVITEVVAQDGSKKVRATTTHADGSTTVMESYLFASNTSNTATIPTATEIVKTAALVPPKTIIAKATKKNKEEKLGIMLRKEPDGSFTVRKMQDDSPFQKTALQVGMKLMKINGVELAGKDFEFALQLLKDCVGQVQFQARDPW